MKQTSGESELARPAASPRVHARRSFGGGQLAAAALVLLGAVACASDRDGAASEESGRQQATQVLAPQLNRNLIPKFQTQLQRFPSYVPTLVRNAAGNVIRKEFNVEIAKFMAQQLPAGFPATQLFGYGGTTVDVNGNVNFRRTSPGPMFEQTRNIPARIRFSNQLEGQHPLAVDPTLDWANPNNFPKPTAPFLPFPPGYPQAQSPIVHVTHTHGIEVDPSFDGTPDTWFSPGGIVGPEFVSTTYTQPSSNESAAFWYHDHSFGVTRLDVGMGLSGFSILRDPGDPLDQVGNADIVNFEDPYVWTTTVPGITVGLDSRHTQGSFSVSVNARGFVPLTSQTFPLTGPLASNLTLDFFLPQQQANPYWFGAVQIIVNCPSKSVFNAFVGQVELTGKTLNAFNPLTFPVPANIASAIGNSCEDFSLRVAINVPENATGTYLLDNLRGLPVVVGSPLPNGQFEVPLIIQDRSFRTDGSVFYPTVGDNPDVNPYWVLMFNGDTNVVNGTVWPNMNVKRHQYRFRILNSANQRFYTLSFSNGMSFKVIGSDGGYLREAETITEFQIGVTERVDILVDFSQFAPGTQIIMRNTGQLQPPIGDQPDPNNDGLVMRFTVEGGPPVAPKPLPAVLNEIDTLTPDRPERILIQNIQSDDQGRILQAELDGQLFHELTTELPTVGSTEDWVFVNLTPLTHNKHVHLIQFQVIERQDVDATSYLADWLAANGNPPFDHPTLKLPIEPYLIGTPEGPNPEESGWKDTVRTPAGQITRIRIRWAPTDESNAMVGVNSFPIDPLNGIGFIWHCHLLEHEDNEMMRPMTVIPLWQAGTSYPVGNRNSPGIQGGLVDFNGVDFAARVAHTSTQPPPQRFDLWERINNGNGDWALQTIYNVGDRVFFGGQVWRALQQHQAVAGTEPPVSPAFWELVL